MASKHKHKPRIVSQWLTQPATIRELVERVKRLLGQTFELVGTAYADDGGPGRLAEDFCNCPASNSKHADASLTHRRSCELKTTFGNDITLHHLNPLIVGVVCGESPLRAILSRCGTKRADGSVRFGSTFKGVDGAKRAGFDMSLSGDSVTISPIGQDGFAMAWTKDMLNRAATNKLANMIIIRAEVIRENKRLVRVRFVGAELFCGFKFDAYWNAFHNGGVYIYFNVHDGGPKGKYRDHGPKFRVRRPKRYDPPRKASRRKRIERITIDDMYESHEPIHPEASVLFNDTQEVARFKIDSQAAIRAEADERKRPRLVQGGFVEKAFGPSFPSPF